MYKIFIKIVKAAITKFQSYCPFRSQKKHPLYPTSNIPNISDHTGYFT
jgi:hypothetical protein